MSCPPPPAHDVPLRDTARVEETILDCDEGRRRGCATYCCRLIVRYSPDDRPVYDEQGRRKSCVDKHPRTGLCVHMDETTHRCREWDDRPRVCREFDCNRDPLLPTVLEEGFVSLTRLVTARPRHRREPAHVPALPPTPRKHGTPRTP